MISDTVTTAKVMGSNPSIRWEGDIDTLKELGVGSDI
jgi:hypothetical protein